MTHTAQHTPGPWTVDETWGLIMADGNIEVATVHTGAAMHTKRNDKQVAMANAALIASAPELLSSLEQLSDWMRSHCGPKDSSHDMLCVAVEVLAKAKGEAS